ncbi:TlpA family protein disulfide reductase [Streptomyces sp. NPDC017993]|uniref:TlpA family protein disulfide reductase n=1 Tax=Streptomyces sp. NPDC017993 TaxID=3365027 RepID=UPI0037AA13D4
MSACRILKFVPRYGRRALLAGVVALSLSACDGGASDQDSRADYVPGKGGVGAIPVADRKPAPDISGGTTRGKSLDIADYKGKVVVLNVWGSTCGPCIAEAPDFAKVAKAVKGKGVAFVGINVGDAEKAQAVSFEERHKTPYPSLFDPTAKLLLRFPKGTLPVQAIPATIVLDRQGRPAARTLGALGQDELRGVIAPVVAEK